MKILNQCVYCGTNIMEVSEICPICGKEKSIVLGKSYYNGKTDILILENKSDKIILTYNSDKTISIVLKSKEYGININKSLNKGESIELPVKPNIMNGLLNVNIDGNDYRIEVSKEKPICYGIKIEEIFKEKNRIYVNVKSENKCEGQIIKNTLISDKIKLGFLYAREDCNGKRKRIRNELIIYLLFFIIINILFAINIFSKGIFYGILIIILYDFGYILLLFENYLDNKMWNRKYFLSKLLIIFLFMPFLNFMSPELKMGIFICHSSFAYLILCNLIINFIVRVKNRDEMYISNTIKWKVGTKKIFLEKIEQIGISRIMIDINYFGKEKKTKYITNFYYHIRQKLKYIYISSVFLFIIAFYYFLYIRNLNIDFFTQKSIAIIIPIICFQIVYLSFINFANYIKSKIKLNMLIVLFAIIGIGSNLIFLWFLNKTYNML